MYQALKTYLTETLFQIIHESSLDFKEGQLEDAHAKLAVTGS